MNTPLEPLDRQPTCASDGLRRIAFFLLLFSSVLCVLLFLSRTFLLPRIAQIDVNGTRMNASDLGKSYDKLVSDITVQEQARDASILPLQDATYDALKQDRSGQPSLTTLRDEIVREANALVSKPDAIHLSSADLDVSSKTLVLQGDVRNVGPSSETVLASFVALLHKLPFVSSVKEPTYQRLSDSAGSFHSPFTISLSLK